MTDIPGRFVKLDEVKRRVGVGTSMIYRLIREGEIPPPSSYHRSCGAGATGRSSRKSLSRAADHLLAFRADATGDDQHDMAAWLTGLLAEGASGAPSCVWRLW